MTRERPRCPMLLLVLAAAPALAAVACTPFGQKPASDLPPVFKDCGPNGLIDDFEDNNNQIATLEDRGGYWYTYADKEGSTITPEQGDKGGVFTLVEGGHDSKYAVEMKGKLAAASIVYAAMGLNFLDPKEPYDASKYEGVSFYAKRAPTSTSRVIVKMPDVNTDPDGGVCSACFNDFFTAVDVGDKWQRYVVPFHDMRQEGEWGTPRKPHIDSKKVYAIHWEVKAPGADFDVWVDDIAFVCKG